MPVYEVSLARSFVVKIQAESAKDAMFLSEFYLSYSDGSLARERKARNFLIEEIEMTQNEALEANQVED